MSVSLFQTRMGARFFEGTMPELASGVTRLALAAERIATALERLSSCEGCGDKKAGPSEPCNEDLGR